MTEVRLSSAVFPSLACRPCDNCTKPYSTLSTRLIKPPYAHSEGVWSRCVCSMGPGDDAPIVGGESAQSHPTRDVSYTHLNAMNSQRWGNVHRECLSQIVIDQVFSLYSFMYIGSHGIHSTVGPFFLNVCMTITLRNADIWRMAALKFARGRPQPNIYQYENI